MRQEIEKSPQPSVNQCLTFLHKAGFQVERLYLAPVEALKQVAKEDSPFNLQALEKAHYRSSIGAVASAIRWNKLTDEHMIGNKITISPEQDINGRLFSLNNFQISDRLAQRLREKYQPKIAAAKQGDAILKATLDPNISDLVPEDKKSQIVSLPTPETLRDSSQRDILQEAAEKADDADSVLVQQAGTEIDDVPTEKIHPYLDEFGTEPTEKNPSPAEPEHPVLTKMETARKHHRQRYPSWNSFSRLYNKRIKPLKRERKELIFETKGIMREDVRKMSHEVRRISDMLLADLISPETIEQTPTQQKGAQRWIPAIFLPRWSKLPGIAHFLNLFYMNKTFF